jgi:hypothetical protein
VARSRAVSGRADALLEWTVSVGDRGQSCSTTAASCGKAPPWLAARVAAAGEPFRTRLQPEYLSRRLTSIGFATIVDLDAHELNRRYFAERADGLRVAGSGHVVIASMKLPARAIAAIGRRNEEVAP